MEFTVDRSALVEALEQLQGAVDRRTTIPILSHCLMEAEPQGLRLAATDLEVGMRLFCPARVEASGGAALPARRLLDIVKSLPEGELRVRARESERVQISAGRSAFKLATMAKDNFPTLPAVPQALASVPAGTLSGLIERTAFAMTEREGRYALNGALLLLTPDRVEMVVTDGSRLPLAGRDGKVEGLKSEERLLIPRRAVGQLRRLANTFETGILISIGKDDSHLFFSAGDSILIARKLAGEFPDYQALLTQSTGTVATVEAASLREAVERVALLAPEGNHGIALSFDPGTITLSAAAGDVGEATEVVEASYPGPASRMGFNSLFLSDFLGVVKTGAVAITLKDEQSAAEFKPVEDDSYDSRYLVMPMRF